MCTRNGSIHLEIYTKGGLLVFLVVELAGICLGADRYSRGLEMAMIECPECKGMMSSLAHACPNCGYPNSAVKAQAIGGRIRIDRSWWIAFIVCGLVLLIGGYIALGPLIALHEINIGLQEQDSARLEAYIDFPKLRTNLKEQLYAVVVRQAATDLRDNPFAALGMTIASKLVDSVIDSFVTPSGLANLAAGRTAMADQTVNPTSSTQAPVRGHSSLLFEDAHYSYDGLNTFSVLVGGQDPDRVRFVLSREGLSWKLTNIIIPMGELESHGTQSMTGADQQRQASGCLGNFRFPRGEEILTIGALQTIDWKMPDGDTYYDIRLDLLTAGGDVIGSVINWNWVKYDSTHTTGWDVRTLYSWDPQEPVSRLGAQLTPGLYKLRLTYKYQNEQDHQGACPLEGEFESNTFTLTN
jgi:hypothetical protein